MPLNWQLINEELRDMILNTEVCHRELLKNLERCYVKKRSVQGIKLPEKLQLDGEEDLVISRVRGSRGLPLKLKADALLTNGSPSAFEDFADEYRSFACQLQWKDVLYICETLGFVDLLPIVFYISWCPAVSRADSTMQQRIVKEFNEVMMVTLVAPLRGLAKRHQFYGQLKGVEIHNEVDDYLLRLSFIYPEALLSQPQYDPLVKILATHHTVWIPTLLACWLVVNKLHSKEAKELSKWTEALKPVVQILGEEGFKQYVIQMPRGRIEPSVIERLRQLTKITITHQQLERTVEAYRLIHASEPESACRLIESCIVDDT